MPANPTPRPGETDPKRPDPATALEAWERVRSFMECAATGPLSDADVADLDGNGKIDLIASIHGEGARSAAEAGRNSWSAYVRKPAEQRRAAIVAELQADLAKLAQPAGG